MFKRVLACVVSATLFCASGTSPLHAQTLTSITNNIERAQTVLNDVYSELNYNHSVGDVRMVVRGSYRQAGDTDPDRMRGYQMTSQVELSHAGRALVRKDTFSRPDEDPLTSFYDIDDDHANVKEYDEEVQTEAIAREKYLYQSLIFTPNLFLQVLLRDASKNCFIATDDNYHIIRHNNAAGNIYFLYINTKTYFLEKIVQPMYDAGTGDYFRTTTYSDYDIQDGYQVPGKVKITRDSVILFDLTVEVKEILPRSENSRTRLNMKPINDWLYIVPMPQWNCKAVVAEMKDYLVIFEPPHTPEAGYALQDNVKKAFPGKEIKYCIVSHQHPEYNGGVRPFMEDGTIIVTTEGNRDYFQAIATNKHSFSNIVRVKKHITPKLQFVNFNKYEIKSGDRVIQFFLLNRKSYHANEYLLAYIPSEKLLIESDLVKTWNLKERPLERREKGLVEFIDEQNISVKQVLQTWPLEKSPMMFDYEQIELESKSKLFKNSKKVLDGVFK